MSGAPGAGGGAAVSADLLDRYLAALQAGDDEARRALLRDEPRLAEWNECLEELDLLASGLEPGADPVAVPAGTRYGAYRIVAEIGRGGMGVVYRARQAGLDRDVALKVLAAGMQASDEQRRRFLAEARLAARIRHPGIVVIHDAGEDHGQLYYAMDLIDGEDLAARLARGPLPLAAAVRLVADVARSVAHLHAAGVLHRDLKPRNILLDGDGAPIVTDFGLARDEAGDGDPTATGTILGTPAYMPPEQVTGSRAADARGDVYSLGAILYEILAGRPAFSAPTRLATLLQVLEREPVSPRRWNPGVPRALAAICLRALEKAPDRRPASAAALADELEAFLRGERGPAVGGNLGHRIVRAVRRHPAAGFRLVGIVGTAAVVVVRCLLAPDTIGFYAPVLVGLGAWGALAAAWEWAGVRALPVGAVARLFTLTDGVFVSFLLWLVDGANGPLVAVYPVLVAAAGVWLEGGLVRLAAAMSLVGYVAVLLARPAAVEWHLAAIVALLIFVIAAITDLQLGRLSLRERRGQPPG